MTGLFPSLISYLARRRWAGVGLAILVEAVILLPLAAADPSAIVGIPAVIAATIAGTVAVVFGPLDGAVVAFVGAVLFGAVGGWGAGEVAALVVWPGVVLAAGLFARRVEQQRTALAELMSTQEAERQRVALELHDETAQTLTGALLALNRMESAAATDGAGDAAETTRSLIQETIRNVRELAVELRPKVLDDFGLGPAVERLAEDVTRRTGTVVEVDVEVGEERLPQETELAVFRTVQDVLAQIAAVDGELGSVRIAIDRAPEAVRVEIERDDAEGRPPGRVEWPELGSLRERVRVTGGRLSTSQRNRATVVKVLFPLTSAANGHAPRAG